MTKPPPHGVVVILVDDEALRKDDERLLIDAPPVSHSYLGRLVERIVAAAPKAIVLDFFLDRPGRDAADDQILVRALKNAQKPGIPVVLATRFTEGGERGIPLLPAPPFLAPLDQARLFLGHVNVEKSILDRAVRRVAAGTKLSADQQEYLLEYRRELADESMYFGNNSVYSLSLPMQMLRSIEPSLQKHNNAAVDRVLEAEPLSIRFAAGKGHIEVFSSARVDDSRVFSKMARRIVIIGPGYSEASDRHFTPLSTTSFTSGIFAGLGPVSDKMEGPILLAHSFVTLREAMLHSRQITRVPEWRVNVLMLVLGGGLLIALRRIGRMRAVVPALAIVALLYWVGSIVVFHRWLVWLPVIGPSAVLLGCYLLAHFMERLAMESSENISKPSVVQ